MLRCTLIAALVPLALGGCLPAGEDSWAHYQGGGMYPARTPCMSPDGSVIAFSSPRTGNGDIYLIHRVGSNLTRLTDNSAFETDPIFSPDGSLIAFTREAIGTPTYLAYGSKWTESAATHVGTCLG